MRYTPRPDCQIPCLADIYEKHLPNRIGRFVEVGAFDGVEVSNTVFLAEAGWKGLYIEAHPKFADDCARNHAQHPNIAVMWTGIGAHVGQAELYEVGACSTMVYDKSAIDWGAKPDRKILVPCTTLNLALDSVSWEPLFELLVIDVEQMELQVLAGFDPNRWQPHMVIVETHELDKAPERNFKAFSISKYWADYGYQKIYTDHINSVFVRNRASA